MKGDYIGFTFNGINSEDLHIVRVSNGSRYEENLLPEFSDISAQIVGVNGTYYWDSYFTKKSISISFAFDSVSESNFRNIVRTFSTKELCPLIFEERPYKQYMVKVQSPPQISYIAFDDNEGNRIYKGEGTINFIAYFPFGKSVYKYLNEYNDSNKNEWAAASGMLISRTGTIDYDTPGATINLWNAGDREADWSIICSGINSSAKNLTITLKSGTTILRTLEFKNIVAQNNDSYIKINTATNLIEGGAYSGGTFTPSGSLYNKFYTSGEFFKIPINPSNAVPTIAPYTLNISNLTCVDIKYDYLYY